MQGQDVPNFYERGKDQKMYNSRVDKLEVHVLI